MTFVPDFPVERLRGAEYNPRAISEERLRDLDASIEAIGFAKNIIVCEDGLTVAGHQRTKAARRRGRTTVPAWVLKGITKADEIRFNQLHNGTDLDAIDAPVFVCVDDDRVGQFVDVPAAEIVGDLHSEGAAVRSLICDLVSKYGPWGCVVVGASGEVISSPQYALACMQLGIPCRTYRVPDGAELAARRWFGLQYGQFSYDHLERKPYLQTYAQMFRLRSEARGKSTLYEEHVLPELRRGERILDFGCGQADYLEKLRAEGHAAFGVEFFHRDGQNALDVDWVHRMIDEALGELTARGRFDVVVCDSVLNSVQTQQAEEDVLATVNALVRPGGRVHVSGRRKERMGALLRPRTCAEAQQRRYVEFLDEHGLSAIWRRDGWFFQKFHSDEESTALITRWFGGQVRFSCIDASWQTTTTKQVETPPERVEEALRREFDLAWPEGQSVGRAEQAVAAWRAALAREA